MKKLSIIAVVLILALVVSSCAAGPHQLRRTVDDWDHKMYVESPWIDGILWFVPVFPILTYLAYAGDFLITDAYAFWFKDAWDGKGTAFEHYQVTPTDGSMQSLLINNAKFLKIQ